jgi:hypothetical protein
MTQVVLRNVRLSFPDLFEAKQFQGQGPFSYRASFLMEPDSDNKKKLDAAIKEVAVAKWAAKADGLLAGILPNGQKCCLVDGNTKTYNGYAGNFALSSTRDQTAGKPKVVDRNKSVELTAADGKLYGGCYVNAVVDIWAQDNQFGKAIRATLVTVQFVKDGESFGGAVPASADALDDLDFEDDGDLI